MDFVAAHAPNEEYTQAHEQYRPLVLFHRTQAAVNLAIEKENFEGAIDAIHDGLEKLRILFAAHGVEEHMDEDTMVQQLRKMDRTLRRKHSIDQTLQEQLSAAVGREDYESAARIRDAIRRQQE
jgi:protein-arginine kinase activator protein McsA